MSREINSKKKPPFITSKQSGVRKQFSTNDESPILYKNKASRSNSRELNSRSNKSSESSLIRMQIHSKKSSAVSLNSEKSIRLRDEDSRKNLAKNISSRLKDTKEKLANHQLSLKELLIFKKLVNELQSDLSKTLKGDYKEKTEDKGTSTTKINLVSMGLQSCNHQVSDAAICTSEADLLTKVGEKLHENEILDEMENQIPTMKMKETNDGEIVHPILRITGKLMKLLSRIEKVLNEDKDQYKQIRNTIQMISKPLDHKVILP